MPIMTTVLAQAGQGWHHNHWMWGSGDWSIWIMWLILIVVVVLVAALLLRSTRGPGTGSGRTETPLDVARRRYAQGEISREEFERIKRDLET